MNWKSLKPFKTNSLQNRYFWKSLKVIVRANRALTLEITKCRDYPLSLENKMKKELDVKSNETDLFSITNKEFFIALVKNPFDKGHQSATYHFILIFDIKDILVNPSLWNWVYRNENEHKKGHPSTLLWLFLQVPCYLLLVQCSSTISSDNKTKGYAIATHWIRKGLAYRVGKGVACVF